VAKLEEEEDNNNKDQDARSALLCYHGSTAENLSEACDWFYGTTETNISEASNFIQVIDAYDQEDEERLKKLTDVSC
jgi:hypothetical protein